MPLTGVVSGSDAQSFSLSRGDYLQFLPSELKILIFKELGDEEATKALANSCQSLRAVFKRYQSEISKSVALNMVFAALGHTDWDLVKSCSTLGMVSQGYHPLIIMAHLLNESQITFDDLVLLKHGLRVSPPDLTEEFGDEIMCYTVFWPEYSWKMLYEVPNQIRQLNALKTALVTYIVSKLDEQFDAGGGISIPYATTVDSVMEGIMSTDELRRDKLQRISTNIFVERVSGQDYLLSHVIMWVMRHCDVPGRVRHLVKDLNISIITRRAHEAE
ncbi:hypothetical protein F5Y18DRAFT_427810 [Xylariaceae sp. FL1019]|nr:hypothetical protein F5Y18DRAFT_427810 [Xylariaceae sp. FL1019]